MSDYANPPLREPVAPSYGPKPKSGCGCLFKVLLGLTAIAVTLVAAVWILIMHSPLPLRMVADLIEETGVEENLKLTGLSGSLSSGLNIDKITWNNGEITDVRFRYSGILDVINRNELVIQEMHAGSALIQSDFFSDTPKDTTSESTTDPSTPATPNDPILRLLQIDRLSLHQIILINPATGFSITIPKLVWTGFKAEQGKPIQFGDIEADSDYLAIKTTNPSGPLYQKRLEITLQPKLHPLILKPLPIDAHLADKDHKTLFDIKAFGETVSFTYGTDGIQRLHAQNADLAGYLDAPLPRQLHLEATISQPGTDNATLTVHKGSFLLGTKSFDVRPTTATGPDTQTTGTVLLALCRSGDTEIRYEIPANGTQDHPQSLTPVLSSTPAMTPDDLMALLFHNQPFSSLPTQDQEKLRQHSSWFTFSP